MGVRQQEAQSVAAAGGHSAAAWLGGAWTPNRLRCVSSAGLPAHASAAGDQGWATAVAQSSGAQEGYDAAHYQAGVAALQVPHHALWWLGPPAFLTAKTQRKLANRRTCASGYTHLHCPSSAVCAAGTAQSCATQATPGHLLHTCAVDPHAGLAAGQGLDCTRAWSSFQSGGWMVAHCQSSPGARTPLDQAGCLTNPRTNPTLPLTRVCLCVVVCECVRGIESGGGQGCRSC